MNENPSHEEQFILHTVTFVTPTLPTFLFLCRKLPYLHHMKCTAVFMAFYLLMGSLIPRTDFRLLLHLADLAEHYELHQKEAATLGEETSLSEFFCIHFIHPDGHEHESSDEPLPCQSATFNAPVVLAAPQINTSSTSEIELPLSGSPSYLDQFHSDGYVLVIDHPPAS